MSDYIPWGKIENSYRYGAMSPEEQNSVRSDWEMDFGFDPDGDGYDYETAINSGLSADETGHWPSREPKSGQILKGKNHPTFSKTMAGEQEAGFEVSQGEDGRYYSQQAPKWDPLGAAKDLGKLIYDIPIQTEAAMGNLLDDPLVDNEWTDILRNNGKRRDEQRASEITDAERQNTVLPFTDFLTRGHIADTSQSTGFTGVSMLSSIVGAAAGLLTGPLAPIASISSGMATGGYAAYRMVSRMFVDSIFDEAEKILKRPPTAEEKNFLLEETKDIRHNHALFEAGPEAIGNALAMTGIGKIFGGAAEKAMGKLISGIATTLGGELSTETVTQMGQQRAESDLGMAPDPKRRWLNLHDWVTSFKEVAPQVVILTGVMGGAGALAGRVMREDEVDGSQTDTDQVATEFEKQVLTLEANDLTTEEMQELASLEDELRAAGIDPEAINVAINRREQQIVEASKILDNPVANEEDRELAEQILTHAEERGDDIQGTLDKFNETLQALNKVFGETEEAVGKLDAVNQQNINTVEGWEAETAKAEAEYEAGQQEGTEGREAGFEELQGESELPGEETAKQPWEMTTEEFDGSIAQGVAPAQVTGEEILPTLDYVNKQFGDGAASEIIGENAHALSIANAIRLGEEVPAEVLKEYPKLQELSEAGAEQEVAEKEVEIQVPLERITSAKFENGKKVSKGGDIQGAYSGDTMADNKIRKPFKHDGKLYTVTSIMHGKDQVASAWELVPADEYEGETLSYHEATSQYDNGRERGDETGVLVKYGKKEYVLIKEQKFTTAVAETTEVEDVTEQNIVESETSSAKEPWEMTRLDWESENLKYSGVQPVPLTFANQYGRVEDLPIPGDAPKAGVKAPPHADSGHRVLMPDGTVWEYKGVSGYKVDNDSRVNGWEDVTDSVFKRADHSIAVEKAIAEGKEVSAEVLVDYPNLQEETTDATVDEGDVETTADETGTTGPGEAIDETTTDTQPTETETAAEADTEVKTSIEEQLKGLSDDDISAIFDEVEEELAEKPKKPATTQSTGGPTATTSTPQKPKTAGGIVKEGGIGAVTAVQEAMVGLGELFGGKNTLASGLVFDEETYRKAKPHFIAALNGVKDVGYSIKELVAHLFNEFDTSIRPYLERFMGDVRDGNLEVEEVAEDDVTVEEETTTSTVTDNQTAKTARSMVIVRLVETASVQGAARDTDYQSFRDAVVGMYREAVGEIASEYVSQEGFQPEIVTELNSILGSPQSFDDISKTVYDTFNPPKKKEKAEDKEKDEFDGIEKPKDSGELMDGKRSQKNHRLKELADAIAGEYTGNDTQLINAIIRKTAKPKNMPINVPEGATPGTTRYLTQVREHIIGNFTETVGSTYGGGRASWRLSFKNALIQAAAGETERADIIGKATEWINILETLEEAISGVSDITSARDALLDVIFKPEGKAAVESWYGENPAREDITSDMFTEFGESLPAPTFKTPHTIGTLIYRRAESLLEDETVDIHDGKTKRLVKTRKKIMDIPYSANEYRDGKIIEQGSELDDHFGFRGTEFGEWATKKERLKFLNLMWDAMKDLAVTIGSPDMGVSLSDVQRLGIAFGSRGRGKWSAHFEPDTSVINMTKNRGDGSVAHEWAHGLSSMTNLVVNGGEHNGLNIISDFKEALQYKYDLDTAREHVRNVLARKDYASRRRTAKQDLETAQKFLKTGWKSGYNSIRETTQYKTDALHLDGGSAKYWATGEEMWARAFETFIADQLGENINFYLVDKDWVEPGNISKETGYKGSPYPGREERQYFNSLFTKLFDSIEWSKEGIPSMKEGYDPVTVQIVNEIQAEFDELIEELEEMQKELHQGEPSADGLFWYAYKTTNRGPMLQPDGFNAYDDGYTLETDNKGGQGAIGYVLPLDPVSIRDFDLGAIQHEDSDSTTRLETEDESGTGEETGWTSISDSESVDDSEAEDDSQDGQDGPDTSSPAGPGSDGGSTGGDVTIGGGDTRSEGDNDESVDDDTDRGGDTELESDTDTLAGNYHLTDEDIEFISTANAVQRFTANLSAIRTLKKVEEEGRPVTVEEQSILARYSGWGGLHDRRGNGPLQESYSDEWNSRFQMITELLSEGELKSAKATIIDAFYTPPGVVDRIYGALSRLGFDDGTVLEPAAGVGSFFGLMPRHMKGKSSMVGVEIDTLSARMVEKLYPDASVFHMPFEKAALPDNHFDLVVTNVPFSDQIRPADRKHNKSNFLIHDFFINKAINLARPGGLVAAITSTGTMDKKNDGARRMWARNADLVGAIRLPASTFSDNTNTEVSTDLLIFRKKGEGLPELPANSFIKLKDVELTQNEDSVYKYDAKLNEYFVNNPEMVIGTQYSGWRGNMVVKLNEGEDLLEKLDEAVKKLPRNIYERSTTNTTSVDPVNNIPLSGSIRPGSYGLRGNKLILLGIDGIEESISERTPKEKEVGKKIRAMLKVRENHWGLLRELLAKVEDKVAITKARKALNRFYNDFSKRYGPFSSPAVQKTLVHDGDYASLLALESYDFDNNKLISKADIFTKNTVSRPVEPESFDNAEDALMYSLALEGRIDFNLMSEKTGKSQDELIDGLRGKIVDDPESGWVTVDMYASGNVRQKLAVARQVAKTNPKYDINVKILEDVMPEDITPSEIRVDDMSAPWLDTDDLRDFARHLVPEGTGFHVVRNRVFSLEDVRGSEWSFFWNLGDYRGAKKDANEQKKYAQSSRAATSDYGTNEAHFYKLFTFLLNGSRPTVKFEDGSKNVPATEHAIEKMNLIKQKFEQWLWEDTGRAEKYTKRYNDIYNSMIRPKPDGSHMILPGKVHDTFFKFRPHQLNGIWRSIVLGNTYYGHEVGTGKTATMVASIMEHRRLGLAKKPIMVVLKETVPQIEAEFLRLYPTAKLLVAPIPSGTASNKLQRKKLAHQILNNDWDAVIVTMEQIGNFDLSPVAQAEFIQEELDRFEAMVRATNPVGLTKAQLKNLETAKRAYEAQIEKLLDNPDPEGIYFDELGLDMLIVDEAHKFKNLPYKTKRGSVKGISGGRDTQRSMKMLTKTWFVNKLTPGRNIIFASGTPVSNSIDELFAIQKYLQPNTLDERNIAMFDQWAALFAMVGTESQYKPEGGGYQVVEKVKGFKNIPELIRMVYQVLDVVNAEAANIVRPKMENGGPQRVIVDQSDQVQAIRKHILDRVEIIRATGGQTTYGNRSDGSEIMDNILRILMLGRQAANDPRIVFSDAKEEDISKVNKVSEKILTHYKETKADKGTQLVFVNLGVPKSGRAFDMFTGVKKTLIASGIPAEEIRLAREFKKPAEKRKMNSMVNAGQIRVLIGSTEDMGTGINVQERVRAIHHLDIGWNYADYVQRTGRGLRFGNMYGDKKKNKLGINTIAIYNYSTEGTVDGFMWSTVADKAKFTDQLLAGDVTIRELTVVSDSTISAEQMVAAISNDPLIEEKFELEQEVRTLLRKRVEHLDDQRTISAKVNTELPGRIEVTKKVAVKDKKEIEVLEEINGVQIGGEFFLFEKDGGAIKKAVEKAIATANAKATINKHLNALVGSLGVTTDTEIESTEDVLDKEGKPVKDKDGKVKTRIVKSKERSFKWSKPAKVMATKSSIDGELKLVIMSSEGRKGIYSLTGGVSRAVTTRTKQLTEAVNTHDKNIDKWNKNLEELRPEVGKPFKDEESLAKKQTRQQIIDDELTSRADNEFYTGPQYFVLRDGINSPVRVLGRALDMPEHRSGGDKTPSFFVFEKEDGVFGIGEYASGEEIDGVGFGTGYGSAEMAEYSIKGEYPDVGSFNAARSAWMEKNKVQGVPNPLDIHLTEVQEDVQVEDGSGTDAVFTPSAPQPQEPIKATGVARDGRTRKDIGRLNAAVNKERRRGQLQGVTVSNAVSSRAKKIAGLFGKRVVFFRGQNQQTDPGGVTLRSADDVIYINVASGYHDMAVLGHELLHHLKKDNLDIYDTLVKSIAKVMKVSAVHKKLADLEGFLDRKASLGLAGEEMIADFLGDEFLNPEFWQQLNRQNPTGFKKVVDAVLNFIKSIIGKSRQLVGFESDTFFTDLEIAQSAIRDAVSEYAAVKNTPLQGWQGDTKITAPVFHGSPTFGKGDNFTFGDSATTKTNSPLRGLGFFFAEDKYEAGGYAGPGGQVESVYLRVENPLRVNSYDLPRFNNAGEAKAFQKRKKLQGHDGIYLKDEGHWITFDPNQAKSATGNTGAYSRENDDIRYTPTLSAHVAGTHATEVYKDKALLAKIKKGQAVTLEREPDNQFDQDAIKILVDGSPVGYVPATQAPYLSDIIDDDIAMSGTIDGVFGPTDRPVFKIKINKPELNAIQERGWDSAMKVIGRHKDGRGFKRAAEQANVDGISLENIEDAAKDVTETVAQDQGWVKKVTGFVSGLKHDKINYFFSVLTLQQLADVYGKQYTPVRDFREAAKSISATANEMLQEADRIHQRWSRMDAKVAEKMASIMFRATVLQFDPDQQELEDGSIPANNDVEALAVTLKESRRALAEARNTKSIVPEKRVKTIKRLIAAVGKAKREYESARELVSAFNALPKEAQEMYREVRETYTKRFKQLLSSLEEQVNKNLSGKSRKNAIQVLRLEFDKQLSEGPYFPLSRFGDYVVVVRKLDEDGKEIDRLVRTFERFNNAEEFAAGMRKKGFEVKVKRSKEYTEGDKPPHKFASEVIDVVNRTEMNGKAKHHLLDEINQAFIKALPDLSHRKNFMHRKGVKGYSEDALRAFASNMQHSAKHIAKVKYGPDMTVAVEDMEKGKFSTSDQSANVEGALRNELSTRHNAIMNPNVHPVAQILTSFGFAWNIGPSLASAVVNMTQTPLVAYPIMAAKYGWGRAAKELIEASKDYSTKGKWTGESGMTLEGSEKITAGERRMLDQLVKDGTIDVSQSHDLAAASSTDYLSLAEKGGNVHKWALMMKIVSFPFHTAEVANRQVTALATYRLAKQRGGGHDQAVKMAGRVVEEGHFDYCVDADTECLTESGWKKHDQLVQGETVVAVDEHGTAVHSKLNDVHRFNSGDHKVVEFSNKYGFSMVVTPGHDNLVQNYDSRNKGRWYGVKKVKTVDLKPHHYILRVPDRMGATEEKHIYTDDEVRLIAWIAADGWYSKYRGASKKNDVRIGQSETSRSGNPEILRNLLSQFGEIKEYTYPRKNNNDVFTTFVLPAKVGKIAIDAMPEKTLSFGLINKMSLRQQEILLNTFLEVDGHESSHGGRIIKQKAEINLHCLQAIAIKTGHSASINSSGEYKSLNVMTKTKRSHVRPLARTEKTVDMVWCPETEHGTWIARRNGRVFVTGNSQENRARIMQGNVARVALLFKQYSQNMTFRMGRDLMMAFKKHDVTPEEKRIAKTQLAGMVGGHLLVSGALGFPLAGVIGAAMNALASAFGDDDEPWDFNTEARNFLADNLGMKGGEMVSHGLARGMLPIDIASRLSLSDLWWRGDSRDLEGRALFNHYMMNIAGPTASNFSSFFSGAQSISEGDIWKGTEMMLPKAVKDIGKAIRYSDDGVTNRQRDVLIDDLSSAELVGQLLGFSPARVGEMYEGKRSVKGIEKKLQRRRNRLKNAYIRAVEQHNGRAKQRALADISEWNRSHANTETLQIGPETIRMSMKARARLRSKTEKGIYLPSTREYLRDIGRFANVN